MAENKGQHQGNQGSNLTQQDRERGGRRSASEQTRDDQGQFAGKARTTISGNQNQGQPGRNTGNTNQMSSSGRTGAQADRDTERSETGQYENQGDIEDVDRGGAEWNAEGSEEEHLRRERGMRTPQQED